MDNFDLDRFVRAQDEVYARVIDELSAGRKQSHWMWFIFPQIAGLGFSPMARRYAIQSAAEARAYLAHDVLGQRLIDCTRLVVAIRQRSITDILGQPDDIKFKSSMTLFHAVSRRPVFADAIARFFPEGPDSRTLEILKSVDRSHADDDGT